MTEYPHFRYIVKSDACQRDYPNNKAQRFKNRPSAPIELNGEWEVALKEIVYPNNWFNIPETGKFTFKCFVTVQDKTTAVETIEELSVVPEVEAGYYDTVEDLVSHINEQILIEVSEIFRNYDFENKTIAKLKPAELCNFKYSPVTQRITIESKIYNATICPTTSTKIFRHLGFDLTSQQTVFTPTTGAHQASLLHHFPGLFVYTTMIRPSFVGDVKVPLLRFVPISGDKLEMIDERFELDTEYMRLTDNYINEMEFAICDDTGKEVLFKGGKVQLTLDFRLIGYHGS